MVRELKKMSRDGIIEMDKRNVKLCAQYFKK